MGNFKDRERYYVSYSKSCRIEVSEEIYRIWSHYTNKERYYARLYTNRTIISSSGEHITLPSREVSTEQYNLIERISDCSYIPTSYYERKEVLTLLNEALGTLREDYRLILVLLFFEELTEVQIAERLGVCQATVSNRKHKALELLYHYFNSKGYSYSDILNIFPNI